jgi:outer membrane protein assembly factor BamD
MRLSSYLLFVLMLQTAACSLLPEKVDKTKDWSASKLYSEAKASLDDGDYEQAINYFEKLEARYPFGTYAQQAELEIAYAYYKYDEPESAIAAAQRFIKMNPRHPNVDYAWYIMGLTNYNRGRTFIERFLPQDASQRDTTIMHQAYDDFYQLVKRYPNSRYASDSRQRLIYLRNNMARYEMHVADYYMRRGAYVAAANRAEYVIENYERTTSVPDALIMMVRAYRELRMNSLADDALRVLRLNYPDNPALAQGLDPEKKKRLFGWF